MNLDDLRSYLLSKSAITDLVVARIGIERLNQLGPLPAILLREISLIASGSLSTSSTPGVSFSRIEVACYGSNYAEARAVSEAVRKAPMQQYKGMMDATEVQSVFLDDTSTEVDTPKEGSSEYRYLVVQDYRIAHVTSQPIFT